MHILQFPLQRRWISDQRNVPQAQQPFWTYYTLQYIRVGEAGAFSL